MNHKNTITVGVLALQGDFALHATRLSEMGVSVLLVRKPEQLEQIQALIIPGGESTTLLKLLDDNFRQALREIIKKGLPTLGTCAGLILLANNVTNPSQWSLSCLDVTVERNSYGRQINSFVAQNLQWTSDGKELIKNPTLSGNTTMHGDSPKIEQKIEGVFIRAPRIIAVDSKVKVLIRYKTDPVLIAQNNILGATFHPEVTPQLTTIHELLLAQIVHRTS